MKDYLRTAPMMEPRGAAAYGAALLVGRADVGEDVMSEVDRWNERFASADYHFGTEPNAFLKSKAALLKPGQSVLSVADGEGRNGVWLAEQGLDVHSIDVSPVGIAKALTLAKMRGVIIKAEEADIHTYRWPDAAYDIIVVVFIQFSPPAERAKVFAGIKKALKPGGLLLLQSYSPKQIEYGTGGPARSRTCTPPHCSRRRSATLHRWRSASMTRNCAKARATSASRRSLIWWPASSGVRLSRHRGSTP